MICPKCQSDNPDAQKFCGECATPLTAAEDAQLSFTRTLETPIEALTRGSLFADRYEIIEKLGCGGMGEVYRVEDTKAKEEIALKLIKPEIATEIKTIERFRNELTIARKIAHRNVCKMFDLGEEKGTYYITMEYVPGEDLKSFIRRSKRLSIPSAISIAKQVCNGLAEAHRLEIVHRDLKPNNIMIDRAGSAKIMDFGIARSLVAKEMTSTGMMIGTPEYMSPEQAEGQEVEQRSDIYALGITLYEMVTGSVPFKGDTAFAVGLKHKSETPENPNKLNPQIPEELSRMIMKCLEKRKESRYQNIDEIRNMISSIEKKFQSKDSDIPKRQKRTKIFNNSGPKRFLLYIGIPIVLISLILGGYFLFLYQHEAIDSIAVLPFENSDPDTEFLSDGITESLINKLSQLPSFQKVIARNSILRFKDKDIDPQQTGNELGVDTVLMGQMSLRGDELSISVELIKVNDNSHIWGTTYKRDATELFAIEEAMSNSIIENLRLRLTNEEHKRLAKRQTNNIEAYKKYLQGRFYWNMRTEEGMKKSIQFYEQAIKADSLYALAYSGIADAYLTLVHWGDVPQSVAVPKAKAAATRALEIDESLAEAYSTLAAIKSEIEWDWVGAESGYKRAIALNPSYATAHQWHGEHLAYMGRFAEALGEFKRARELDPLSPIINAMWAWVYYFMGEYEQSVEACNQIIKHNSDFYPPYIYLGWNYLNKGMYKEAVDISEKAIVLSGGNTLAVSSLIIAHASLGEKDKANEILHALLDRSKQNYVSPFHIAKTYAGLKEKELAFEWLERAFQERVIRITSLRYGRWFDDLRSDPRYKALLFKMNLD